MLADSLAASTGWLLFVVLFLIGASLPTLLARLLRLRLPAEQRGPCELAPQAFGSSERTRRSPRHAVGLHRSLLTSGFAICLGLVLISFVAAAPRLGVSGLALAFAFVSPALLVALHARRRSGIR
ncbi:MAG: hypothetical protein JRG86_06705 [Deltaproteobacteria bacterium]|jgi:hypothetical protein|nr:hypothetical protein [Deltaproteobacteria bacterium]MBW2501196.1 hypothetical protein [Deltaproteobacteria bacterium]